MTSAQFQFLFPISMREQQIQKFLSSAGWGDAKRGGLREDASARKYYRLSHGKKTAVLMDAAPPFEEVRVFAEKRAIFASYDWNVPEIYARDDDAGLLLLQDFGDTSFADALAKGADAQSMYNIAIDNLIHLHSQSNVAAQALPLFDEGRLIYLATWIIEWYVPMIQPQTLARTIRERFIDLWIDAFKFMRHVPLHAMHLDYQFHNFMLLSGKKGIASCGLLDFQDACFGPITGDLVLLLQNAREDVPQTIVDNCTRKYLAAFPEIHHDDFHASYAIFSAHNAMRILGLFARLKMREGKGQYLKHIPRNLRYLENSLQHPALMPIRQWFDTHVPAEKRLQVPGLVAA